MARSAACVCAHLRVPPIAALVSPARCGHWRVQTRFRGPPATSNVDGRLAQERLFLHGTPNLTPAPDLEPPWVPYSLDTTSKR